MYIDFKYKKITENFYVWWVNDIEDCDEDENIATYVKEFNELYYNKFTIEYDYCTINAFSSEKNLDNIKYYLNINILKRKSDIDIITKEDFNILYKFMVYVNDYGKTKLLNLDLFEKFVLQKYSLEFNNTLNNEEKILPCNPVSNPSHYQLYLKDRLVQVKDITGAFIENFTGNKMVGVYLWNSLKYIFRCDKKENIKQDLNKAKQYIDFALEELENE